MADRLEPRRGLAAGDGRMLPRLTGREVAVLVGAQVVAGAVAIAVLRLLTFHPDVLPVLVIGAPVALLLAVAPQWTVPAFIALSWTLAGDRAFGDVPSPIDVGAAVLFTYAAAQALGRPGAARDPLLVTALIGIPLLASGLLSNAGSELVPDGLTDLAFLLIGALAITSAADLRRAVFGLALVALPLGIGALYSVTVEPSALFPVADTNEVAAGPVGDPELFALTLATLAPFAAYVVFSRGRIALLGVASLVAIAIGIVTTGAFDALAVAAAGVAVLAFTRRGGLSGSAVPLLVAALALAAAPLPGARAQSDDRLVDPPSGSGRVALEMFGDRPLTGAGPGRYVELHAEYADEAGRQGRRVDEPRSLPLQLAAEQGLIGLLGWCAAALLAASAISARRIWTGGEGAAILAALGAFLAGSLFLNGGDLRPLYLLLGMAMAVPARTAAATVRQGRQRRAYRGD